jgi:hypothetical protein
MDALFINHYCLTQMNRELQHFTDRHELIMGFVEALNEQDRQSNQILFFSGDGGNGKSLLLRYLLTHFCKGFPQTTWQEIKAKSIPETVEFIKTVTDWECNFKIIPAVLLDFDLPVSNEESNRDSFYGLLKLYRQLVINTARLGYKLSCPLYEFACILYLRHKGKLTNESLNKLFPAAEFSLVGVIFNTIKTIVQDNKELAAVLALPGVLAVLGASILNILVKHFGQDLTLYFHGRGLQEKDFESIAQLEPERELIDALPNLLAEDIKVALQTEKAPEKLILFFDTHEAFWGEKRDCASAIFFKQDEWLRCLLAQLIDSPKVIIVMAGREPPRWQEARCWRISRDKLECRQVFNFKESDALDYLTQVGIEAPQLRSSLIKSTRFEGDLVHPLLLRFSVEIVSKAQEKGQPLVIFESVPPREQVLKLDQHLAILVERLMKYTDREIEDTVCVLSACRTFNEDIYFYLGQALRFNTSHAAFELLLRFSFIWPLESEEEKRYRLHPLIRRFNLEQQQERTQIAHQFLERYYRDRGNLSEAIYHVYWQNPLKAKEEWIAVFQQANQQKNNELCQNLEQIKNAIPF